MSLDQLRAIPGKMPNDPGLGQIVQAAATAEHIAQLPSEHGVQLLPEALWRHRGNQQNPAAPTTDHQHFDAAWDVESQLQRTQQWQADAAQLLHPPGRVEEPESRNQSSRCAAIAGSRGLAKDPAGLHSPGPLGPCRGCMPWPPLETSSRPTASP